jgi:hypothetical protein
LAARASLTHARAKDDLLSFFDQAAFADNPDWSDCYCSLYHFCNRGNKDENRRKYRPVAGS